MPRPKRRLPRPPRLPFPTRAEREYVALLQRRTKALRDFTLARLMPALERASAALGVRQDDDRDEVDHLYATLKGLRVEWEHQPAAQQLELPLGHIAEQVSANGKAGLRRQVKAVLGINPLIHDKTLPAKVAGWTHGNVALIKTVDSRYFSEIEGIVHRGLAAGTRPETMAESFAERYGVSVSRGNVIARTETGKLHAGLDRQRQQDLGIESYIWRTAEDERVRPVHAERDGLKFRYDDPPGDPDDPGDGANPGDGVMCRCSQEPCLEDLLSALENSPDDAASPDGSGLLGSFGGMAAGALADFASGNLFGSND